MFTSMDMNRSNDSGESSFTTIETYWSEDLGESTLGSGDGHGIGVFDIYYYNYVIRAIL